MIQVRMRGFPALRRSVSMKRRHPLLTAALVRRAGPGGGSARVRALEYAQLKQHGTGALKQWARITPPVKPRPTMVITFGCCIRDADGFARATRPDHRRRHRQREGTLLLGGKMINAKGQRRGGRVSECTGIEGERHPLGAGDVVHIPARIPHSFLVPQGKHITYVLGKVPAPRLAGC